jgi:glycerol-3-phosphate dehydrogenase
MRHLQTEVLVIGGGATGTGVARDLAMRGFKTVLVERGDLSHGTTGRFHGLLHSGGRYVVKDPPTARECIAENRILRRIMPQCIENTGGFFVVTPWDDIGYAQYFVEGCHKVGIPCEEIPIPQMLREEPSLNPAILRCFRLPDASADSFLASELNAEAARHYGAQILTYHPVTSLAIKEGRQTVVGALCHNLTHDEEVTIHADMVVNASGAWVGKIAATIGVPILIRPGKGTMIAISHRVVNTVINRCKMPADGDILVPAHTVAVIGTTDEQVADPDHFTIEPWEVQLMLDEGEKLIPRLKDLRILRAWAGVRPLVQEATAATSRDLPRAYVLLDHEKRDGISGLITITSGKWTTYRLMAQATADLVCAKLGVWRPCRTHLEPLPGTGERRYHHLGARLGQIEKARDFGELICECELVTRAEVERAITIGKAKTLDDIRRDTRLGMGPCQGGFCTYRAAGILHQLAATSGQSTPVYATNLILQDFLQERWKGLIPILWGQQLRQERLDELIALSILNLDHLPGGRESRGDGGQTNGGGGKIEGGGNGEDIASLPPISPTSTSPSSDTLIIGAGLAGLVAAWQAASRGDKTRLITKGWGATHWQSGCVDVLGYYPLGSAQPIESPADALARLIQDNPRHPYALVGLNRIEESLRSFQFLCAQEKYPLHGSSDHNWLLPSAVGAMRPTCLAPETMIAGDLRNHAPMLIVGFEQFRDFYPALIAENLTAQGIPAAGVMLNLPILRERRFVSPTVLARLFENQEFRAAVVSAIRPFIGKSARIGFPAVLGVDSALTVKSDLENQLGCPVFEIPTLPPSIPGMRLHKILMTAIERAGGRVFEGMQVLSAETENGRVTAVFSEAAARQKLHRAANFVLATGGILGGGVTVDHRGYAHDTVFDLPLTSLPDRTAWFRPQFLDPAGHPIFSAGISVDHSFRPLDDEGRVIYSNLFAIGNTLAFADPLLERSFDGVALSTGYCVGIEIASLLPCHP